MRDLIYVAPRPQGRLMEELVEAGWNPVPAGNLEEVTEICRRRAISVGIVELGDQQTSAFPISELVAIAGPEVQWIALGARQHLERAELRSTVARYCYDFATLPVPIDRLAVTLGRAYGMVELRKTLASTHPASPPSILPTGHGILGTSQAIEAVRRSIASFATTDAPVLIVGETGTGKELAASVIHALSGRRHGPLVSVSCSLLPASLMEAELFGHERGSARPDLQHVGKLESANNGTLILDEVGDLAPQVQVSLLHFLEERRIDHNGTGIEPDVRLITATSSDLERAVREGRFRQDLFYRLNILLLKLPPLREREEDIELLAHHFLKVQLQERPGRILGFTPEALSAMRLHSWPGNVRELVNRVRRALILCESDRIGAGDLGLDGLADSGETLSDVRRQAEVTAVRETFLKTGGNVSEAARRLKVTRSTLYRLIRKYELDPMSWDTPEHVPHARHRMPGRGGGARVPGSPLAQPAPPSAA